MYVLVNITTLLLCSFPSSDSIFFRSSYLIQNPKRLLSYVRYTIITTIFIQSKSLLSVFNGWACEYGPYLPYCPSHMENKLNLKSLFANLFNALKRTACITAFKYFQHLKKLMQKCNKVCFICTNSRHKFNLGRLS